MKVLRDLTEPEVQAPPRPPLFIGIQKAKRVRELDFNDPKVLPPPAPKAAWGQSSHVPALGWAAGAQRTAFKRPVPRGTGRLKRWSGMLPRGMESHPVYKELEVLPTRVPNQIVKGDLTKLEAAGFEVRIATHQQVTAKSHHPLLRVGEQTCVAYVETANGPRRATSSEIHGALNGSRQR